MAERMPLPAGMEDEDEEDVCRICRMPAEEDQPLRYPCRCRGSIKFVHPSCLVAWLKHSGNTHCEVRRHTCRPDFLVAIPRIQHFP